MTARVRNVGAAVAGAALLASGAYALGSQAGGGSAAAHGGPGGDEHAVAVGYGPGPHRFERGRFHDRRPGFELDALAKRLGVSTSALRAALADIRQDLPSRTDMAAKLAAALGVPVDKVNSALDQLKPERGDFAADLAKALDLDTAKVEAALQKVKSQFRPHRGQGKADFMAALANELGVSTDKLESALRSLRPFHRGHERRSPDALAKALGVTTEKLRAAFEKIRSDVHDAFVAALAKRLNLDQSKVEEALGSGPGPFGFGHRHP
jgi:transcriptional regulator with XRE-family HTH domain